MELVNSSPFSADRLVMMDGYGFERLLVVIKGRFDLQQMRAGVPLLAPTRPPLHHGDRFRGSPRSSSLLAAGDLCFAKPGTDVVLQGHAYPRARGDAYVDVALRVGSVAKTVRAFGERVWTVGLVDLAPSHPRPLSRVPLVYELAFGGADPFEDGDECAHNPAGVGFRGATNRLDFRGRPAPQLESLRDPVTRPGRAGTPACFGPIPPHWAPRRGWAGTYDDGWRRRRMPLLPEDFDPRFFHTVPPDQVLPETLRGGEEVGVHGATPQGVLVFRVPRDRPSVRIVMTHGEERLRPRCDTMIIDTDTMTLDLVWRAELAVQDRVPTIDAIRVRYRGGWR